jgi:hypothetical protein
MAAKACEQRHAIMLLEINLFEFNLKIIFVLYGIAGYFQAFFFSENILGVNNKYIYGCAEMNNESFSFFFLKKKAQIINRANTISVLNAPNVISKIE